MTLLKTDRGWISSRWIVTISLRPQGDYAVTYTYGSGALDAVCSAQDGRAFLGGYRMP